MFICEVGHCIQHLLYKLGVIVASANLLAIGDPVHTEAGAGDPAAFHPSIYEHPEIVVTNDVVSEVSNHPSPPPLAVAVTVLPLSTTVNVAVGSVTIDFVGVYA